MIRLFFARFWIVLLPFVLYALWLVIITRRAKDGHYVGEHIRKAAFFWTSTASVILLIVSCIWWSLSQPATGGAHYSPPTTKDGILIPALISPTQE
jgi:hypothetical protein